jgi:uncharacterized protein YehS (DUF1456 family)
MVNNDVLHTLRYMLDVEPCPSSRRRKFKIVV